MSWTKRELCEEAYAELAMAGYVFDLSPEEMERAGRRLDIMLAQWDLKGIKLGYAQSSSPSTLDLSADSGLPLVAIDAVVTNLAVRLCAGLGKAAHPSTVQRAKEGYDALMAEAAIPAQQQLRAGLPLGAGNRRIRTFTPEPDTSPLQQAPNGDLEFLDP